MHILLVTIDSLRGDHLGCYGAQDIRTPHLDTFAGSGVRFHQNLSSLATTLPSHTSLITGCVPSVHGVNWNGVVTPRRRRTLAEIAAAAGYATTAITSWGGFQNQEGLGFQQVYSDAGAGAEDNRGDRTITRVETWLEEADGSQPQLLWVPLLIRCPGLIAPGRVVDELTRQIDILPTLLDYCDLPMPYDVQGMSLRGMISGDDVGLRLVHRGQAVHSEADTVTVRTEDHTFFFEDRRLVHVFDRQADPDEDTDLWPEGAARQSVAHSVRDGRER